MKEHQGGRNDRPKESPLDEQPWRWKNEREWWKTTNWVLMKIITWSRMMIAFPWHIRNTSAPSSRLMNRGKQLFPECSWTPQTLTSDSGCGSPLRNTTPRRLGASVSTFINSYKVTYKSFHVCIALSCWVGRKCVVERCRSSKLMWSVVYLPNKRLTEAHDSASHKVK